MGESTGQAIHFAGGTLERTQHSGGLVIDILRTHPMVVAGGVLYSNPFFMPPEQFLRELCDRVRD